MGHPSSSRGHPPTHNAGIVLRAGLLREVLGWGGCWLPAPRQRGQEQNTETALHLGHLVLSCSLWSHSIQAARQARQPMAMAPAIAASMLRTPRRLNQERATGSAV